MKDRITNETEVGLGAEQARALLRKRHLQTDVVWPGLNVVEVLQAAYPEAERPRHSWGEPGGTDWQKLALALAFDFVPAFQPGAAPGRPVAKKDGLVEAVDRLISTGKASNITHACNIVERGGLFPEVTAVRKAYYRRKKKLSS